MSGRTSPYAAFRETAQLLPIEVAGWRRNGSVKPAWRLPTALLLRIQDTLAISLAGPAPALEQPHVPRDGDEDMELARDYFDYVTNPDFLDLVAALLGPDLVVWEASLVLADAVGDHQPTAVPIDPPISASLWIALDDLSLRVGSGPALAIEAGQLLVLDDTRAHATPCVAPGGERQAGLAVRYMSASARFVRERAEGTVDSRPLWLVRGSSLCPENDFDLGHLLW